MINTDDKLEDVLEIQTANENQKMDKYNNLPQNNNNQIGKPNKKKCQYRGGPVITTIIFVIFVSLIVLTNKNQVKVRDIILSIIIYAMYLCLGYLILQQDSYFKLFSTGISKDTLKQNYKSTIKSSGQYRFEIFCYKQIYPNLNQKCNNYYSITIKPDEWIDLSDTIEDILIQNKFMILQFKKQCSLKNKQCQVRLQIEYNKFLTMCKNKYVSQICKRYSQIDNFEDCCIFVSEDGERQSLLFRIGFHIALGLKNIQQITGYAQRNNFSKIIFNSFALIKISNQKQ